MSRPPVAHGVVRTARTIDRCEVVREAMLDGAVSIDQVTAILGAMEHMSDRGSHPVSEDDRERAQRYLVAQAKEFGPDQLRRLGEGVWQQIDPQGADAREAATLAGRERRAAAAVSFSVRRRGDGTSRGVFVLPDLQADLLHHWLRTVSRPRRRGPRPADDPATPPGAVPPRHAAPAGATADLAPRGPTSVGDTVDQLDERRRWSGARRMGQAFAELAEHLPTTGWEHAGGIPTSLNVTIPVATLDDLRPGVARTEFGEQVSVGQTRRLACNAGILPMVLGSDSTVLDLGRTSRLFTRPQRTALAHRDGGCVFPNCDRPPGWTEAHHIVWWSEGGPTDLDNGCLLCAFHHHLVHQGEWRIRVAPDGVPELVPPARIDSQQLPRRNRLHQLE